MKSTNQVSPRHSLLVRRITTVPGLPGSDAGRYVTVQTLSSHLTKSSFGCSFLFRDLKGIEVSGKVIDMSEEQASGHFPMLAEGLFVVDTRPVQKEDRRKQMQKGGIAPTSGVRPSVSNRR